jgi:regulator of sigma E protease
VIARFSEHSAAQAAGLQLGDRIVTLDGASINDFQDIAPRVALYPEQVVRVSVNRAGRQLEVQIKVARSNEKDSFGNDASRGLLGVGSAESEVRRVGPLTAIEFGVSNTAAKLRIIAVGLKQIVFGERSLKEMSGLPTTAKASGEMLSLGIPAFVEFVAFVSINLAFINLLPIPTLDGGHLAIYAAEAIRRKPLGLRSQEMAFRIGFAFVLALMVFVNVKDLAGMFL